MKQNLIVAMAFVALLMASSLDVYAQCPQNWEMAVMECGQSRPVVKTYDTTVEKAVNGMEYLRIYDQIVDAGMYTSVKLQYGYRLADKQIFVYDFESGKETLAFDFRLSPGDVFTTYNGMEWKVESAKDTLVDISDGFFAEGTPKRLLTVRTLDGKRTDRWLEDFGSLTGHLMIHGPENIKMSRVLWLDYCSGDNLVFDFSEDPLFGHDSGWLTKTYDGEEEAGISVSYKDGTLTIKHVMQCYEHRRYTSFYRDGDDIYCISSTELTPHVDGGGESLRMDVVTLTGLPTPTSGEYTVHIDEDTYVTGIDNVDMGLRPAGHSYDLQGRKLSSHPEKVVYIRNGQKFVEGHCH